MLYIDMCSGVAGDMFVGACLDLGVPMKVISDGIAKLGLKELRVRSKKGKNGGISGRHYVVEEIKKGKAVKADAHHHHHHEHKHSHSHDHHHRTLEHITTIISKANLGEDITKNAIAIFKVIAKAEAKVHGTTVNKIHFHEVGALDAIADVVGACIAMDYLKPDKVVASPYFLGSGHVHSAHGNIAVPVPATLEIIMGKPSRRVDTGKEMSTPTGAAIVAVFADEFSVSTPTLAPIKIGYGCGTRVLPGRANVLRMIISEPVSEAEPIQKIECTIDDMNPQLCEDLFDNLYSNGALDVYIQSVMVKKSRPGFVVSVIVHEKDILKCEEVLFRGTTTIGLRKIPMERTVLKRKNKTITYKGQKIRIKEAYYGKEKLNAAPEYDDVKRAAVALKVSVKHLLTEVLCLAH